MTKRFTVDIDEAIIDNTNQTEYAYWENKGIEDLCELLNELNNENIQLKFQLKECREHKLFSRRQLEQENKELKHYNEAYADEIVNNTRQRIITNAGRCDKGNCN